MLIQKPKNIVAEVKLSELQKIALEFIPKEQVTKFSQFPHLIEVELENEAREPEMDKVLKDIFNALHDRNTPKLLRALQGDRKTIFYAFKKQLDTQAKSVAQPKPQGEGVKQKNTAGGLNKQQAKMYNLISNKEVSLITIALMKN